MPLSRPWSTLDPGAAPSVALLPLAALCLVLLLVVVPQRGDAQPIAAEPAAGAGPGADARYLALPPHPIAGHPRYRHPDPCWPHVDCWVWPRDDRRESRRPVAPDPPPAVDPDIWGTSGSPWGYVRRLPPPTPEGNIQPRFRDASTVRPEFAAPAGAASAPASAPQ